jgi:5-methylcytosine-specific restriction endonuclease McrA
LESDDFLFTWKPDKWPYEKLRALTDAFAAGQVVEEPWRCQAHRQIGPGKRAYLFKQGAPPRGIFGIAEVVGPAEETDDAEPGEGRYMVPLQFKILFDPTKRLLVTEYDLLRLPAPHHRWRTQASGIRLEPKVARAIDAAAARMGLRPTGTSENDDGSDTGSPQKRERLVEAYDRDQTLANELKRLYGGQCQICGSVPFNGVYGEISEAHHIKWLSRGGPDSRDNLILLCPNHHAAMHSADPEFDRTKLEFRFGSRVVPVRLNHHLKPSCDS